MLMTLTEVLQQATDEELLALRSVAYAAHTRALQQLAKDNPAGDYCTTCDMCPCGQTTGALRNDLCSMLYGFQKRFDRVSL